jgi:hypothetical protein
MKSGKAIGTIFGIALAFSFVLAGCETGTSPTANADPKTIIITRFPGSDYSGKAAVLTLHPSLTSKNVTAVGRVEIIGNRLTIPLYTDENFETRWEGTGEYNILLMIANITTGVIEKVFLYSDVVPNYYGTNVPKYSITESISTVDFLEFYDITEWAKENGIIQTANADPKTIIITNFSGSGYSGKVAMLTLHPSFEFDEITAIGGVLINGNRLTIPLCTDENLETRWNGSGEYYVLLMIGNTAGVIEKVFLYSDVVPGTNVPKYSITEPVSTIQFWEFYDITEWAIENGLL